MKNHSTLFRVFTGRQADGNRATVHLVDNLPDDLSHNIASLLRDIENTAVYIKPLIEGYEYDICWFNPKGRIQRCGHGTLAAAAFLQQTYKQSAYLFHSVTESLKVEVLKNSYSLKLPIEKLIEKKDFVFNSKRAAQTNNEEGYLIVELNSEEQVKDFRLSPKIIKNIKQRALIITAQSGNNDIVFRYFAPQYDIEEDSATGSAASVLWPFWIESLSDSSQKNNILCYQASREGGSFEIKKIDHELSIIGNVTPVHK
ncbi:MAG: PhzF family phenazine biosynthesis protein [Cellvibrionaceae bacterium]